MVTAGVVARLGVVETRDEDLAGAVVEEDWRQVLAQPSKLQYQRRISQRLEESSDCLTSRGRSWGSQCLSGQDSSRWTQLPHRSQD